MPQIFVGDSRRHIVDALALAFDEVTYGSGSRVAVLVSQPGWGKTRIVQELYRRLAAGQSHPAYWPPAIVDEEIESASGSDTLSSLSNARKAVYPTHVTVPPRAEMDWMWWGVLCQQRSHGRLAQAMFDDATQLYGHAEALMRDRPDAAGRAFDIGSAVIDVLGLLGLALAPPAGAVITIAGAAKTGWANRDVLERMREWRSNNRGAEEGRVLLADSPVHREDEIARLLDGLGRLTRARPMVLVVDDAHFADETLVRVVGGLVREGCGRVLVIATAWPSHLDASAGVLPFAPWMQELAANRSGRYMRFDLDELTDDDVHAVVRAELPAAEGLSQHIKELYGTNLLAIRSVLRLPRVRRLADAGKLDINALGKLPKDIEAVFAEHWAGLPEGVQHVLALAAQPSGIRFLPDVVAAACETQGIIESARERIAEGVSPYAWTRELDKSLHTFVEPVLDEIAKARTDELLDEEEIEALHSATVDAVLRIDSTDLSASARQELLEQHVTLAMNGSAPQNAEAARSALTLAETYASRYAYAEAIDLAQLAIDWSEFPFDHPDTLEIRSALAGWLGDAGKVDDAVKRYDSLLADSIRVLGAEHPDTLRTRANLAAALQRTGRGDQAVARYEALLTDIKGILGADHPDTLSTRMNFADALHEIGRADDAAVRYEALLADSERILGVDHPDTLLICNNLAAALHEIGRGREALTNYEALVADSERIRGADHRDTLRARGNLLHVLQTTGRADEALTGYEGLLADSEHVLGADHPGTLLTRNNLAAALLAAGRPNEAVTRYEALLADQERILGADHPSTLTTRNNLASALQETGRTDEAVTRYEALLADQERILGADHPSTLRTRINLASALQETGRADEAVTRYEALLADLERVLGADHLHTLTTRNNLASALRATGRTDEAVTRYEALLADLERVLGADHPHTLTTRINLASALEESTLALIAEAERVLRAQKKGS